ncbi:MAG: 23S rRNA pseudouridine(955/2504/2580) synthase RluC [Gammaproteobacteria bacterium]|nr:23S rRNA pseudouridine(955/2504/2580) synthase RluC [Gammaproteobacteria bacterium]
MGCDTNVQAKVQKPVVEFIEIDDDLAGQRIDNFLLAKLKGVPKSHVYRILRKGEVRVNKGRSKPIYRLKAGDIVRIPPVRQGGKSDETIPSDRVLERLESSILYEDKSMLILNKPSGIAVHGGSGVSYGVIEGLRALKSEEKYLELVHRLDRETSGCLLIAKKRRFLRSLHEQLRNKQTEKRYLALVRGRWVDAERRVEAPLHKNVMQSGERIVRVSPQGKQACSVFRGKICNKMASLLELSPVTGRTHQLRVHAAFIEYPIAGDEKYGDNDFNKNMRSLGLKRLFLHANYIRFNTPDGETMQFRADLPAELQKIIDQVSNDNGTSASSTRVSSTRVSSTKANG